MPTPTQSAPVTKHKNWRFLLRDFIAVHRKFSGTSASTLSTLLQAPASAAWWILAYRPDLAQRNRLDLLVAGASLMEAADEGRWWAYLPWMLGKPGLQCSVTLVGNELTGDEDPRTSTGLPLASLSHALATPLASLVSQQPPAAIVNGYLSKWGLSSPPTPDLCLLFEPGFEEHYETWLTDSELLPLMRADVPLAAFSYSKMDFQSDIFTLEACGLPVTDPASKDNPWSVDTELSEFLGSFARKAWHLASLRSAEPLVFNETALREMGSLMRYIKESYETEGDRLLETLGSLEPVRRQAEQGEASDTDGRVADALVLLPDDVVVIKSSGRVGRLYSDGGFEFVQPPLTLDAESLASRPDGDGVELQRCFWAIRLHRDHVAPCLTPEDMLADLGMPNEIPQELRALLSQLSLENPVRGTQQATPGSEKFFTALDRQDYSRAAALALEQPALLQAQDEQGKTGVMRLYDGNQLGLLATWVNAGALLNVCDGEGHGLVHDVIRRDDVDTLRLLHSAGQDLNLPGGAGFRPSALTLNYRAFKCLAFLLDQDADITTPSLMGVCVARYFAEYEVPAELAVRIRHRLTTK